MTCYPAPERFFSLIHFRMARNSISKQSSCCIWMFLYLSVSLVVASWMWWIMEFSHGLDKKSIPFDLFDCASFAMAPYLPIFSLQSSFSHNWGVFIHFWFWMGEDRIVWYQQRWHEHECQCWRCDPVMEADNWRDGKKRGVLLCIMVGNLIFNAW